MIIGLERAIAQSLTEIVCDYSPRSLITANDNVPETDISYLWTVVIWYTSRDTNQEPDADILGT